MVAVNMETYKYNSTFSLSEYWRIFTSYTNLGFASVCILVNIRQYSLRLQGLLYMYTYFHREKASLLDFPSKIFCLEVNNNNYY